MKVDIRAAEGQLEKLVEAAQAGEDVILANGDDPVAKLVAIPKPKFKFNILKGLLTEPPPDFFEPLDEEELALWEGGS